MDLLFVSIIAPIGKNLFYGATYHDGGLIVKCMIIFYLPGLEASMHSPLWTKLAKDASA